LVESYKSKLKLYESRQRTEDEFEGDEAEFAHMMSKLLWQKRELHSQYNELIKKIQDEEEKVMKLRVQLKISPLENQFNTS
jgi:predicted transcriptional regulator